MTPEEKQDYLVLAALINAADKLLSRERYSALTDKITGNSAEHIKKRLIEKGYLDEASNYAEYSSDKVYMRYGCNVTDMGIKAYHYFNKKRKWDRAKEISFWVVVAATVITLWFTITDHAVCNRKFSTTQSPQLPDTSKHSQILKPTLKSDTIVDSIDSAHSDTSVRK